MSRSKDEQAATGAATRSFHQPQSNGTAFSLRYVQMLFESEGTTATGYVTEQRRAGAYRMLVDPRLADRTVGAIGFDVGFGDPSYFNRTFSASATRRLASASRRAARTDASPHPRRLMGIGDT